MVFIVISSRYLIAWTLGEIYLISLFSKKFYLRTVRCEIKLFVNLVLSITNTILYTNIKVNDNRGIIHSSSITKWIQITIWRKFKNLFYLWKNKWNKLNHLLSITYIIFLTIKKKLTSMVSSTSTKMASIRKEALSL